MTAALLLDRENRIICCFAAALLHELGHFLGLRHAFSEDPETYDRDICLDSDFCTDTPTYNKAAYDKLLQAYMSSGGSIDSKEKELLLMREDCAQSVNRRCGCCSCCIRPLWLLCPI